MKKGLAKNGYNDPKKEECRLGLIKLFKRENILENKAALSNSHDAYRFIEEVIDKFYGYEFPDKVLRSVNKKRLTEFRDFFQFWDNPNLIGEFQVIHQGKLIKVKDKYLLNLLSTAINYHKKTTIQKKYPIVYKNSDGSKTTFNKGVKIDPIKDEANDELRGFLITTIRISFLREDVDTLLNNTGYFNRTERFRNILTYKILETLGLQKKKHSDDVRNSYIRKHLGDVNGRPNFDSKMYHLYMEYIKEPRNLKSVNSFLTEYYNRIFKI